MSSSEQTGEFQVLGELKKLIEGIQTASVKSDILSILNDSWLLVLLRCNDYNVPAAFNSANTLVNAIRYKHSDWCVKFQPDILKKILVSNAITVLKDKDIEGNCVMMVQMQSWNVKDYSIADLIVSGIIIGFELAHTDVKMQVQGAAFVIDVNGMSFAQAKQVSPWLLKKLIDVLFHSLPLKINAVHVVNMNYTVNALVHLAKPLLPRRAGDLLYTHNSSHSLHSHIRKKSLPSTLRGEMSPDELVLNPGIKKYCFYPERVEWYRKIVEIASKPTN